MNDPAGQAHAIDLDVDQPVWERFFWVAPLVLIGTMEANGGHDLAPKHMAFPMGWENYYGFVCTPSHATYSNIERERVFLTEQDNGIVEFDLVEELAPEFTPGDQRWGIQRGGGTG